MASDPLTSISIHASTLRMLQPFKKADMTWDDVLLDFIEDRLPEEFVDRMVRMAEEGTRVSLEEVRSENDLPHRRLPPR